MSNEEFWSIGLFEGEGCIYVRKDKPQAHLFIRMTDLDVLERFKKLHGGSIKTCTAPTNSNHKQAYRWELCKKKEVRILLERWLPFLSERRKYKASDAIDNIDSVFLYS